MESIEKVCDIKYTLLRKKKKVTSIKMYEPKFEALGQKREVSRKKRDLDKLKKKLHGNLILVSELFIVLNKKFPIFRPDRFFRTSTFRNFYLYF